MTIARRPRRDAAKGGARVRAGVRLRPALRPSGIAVLAGHGRGGVLRRTLGSTTEGAIDRDPGPILIVRAGTATGAGREQVPDHAVLHAV